MSIPASAPIPANLADAYAWCERFARSHYENFPVASFLLPKAVRPHIAAIYAFARSADDFADEGQRPHEERYRLLEDWRELLWRAAEAARAAADGGLPHGSQLHSPLFRALGHTIRVCDLEVSLLEDLLSAFRQDVATTRYETWADLFDYCRRSANPVGRLVLRVCGFTGKDVESASDAVCTALQLTNFWQDLAIDYTRGRLYLPREEWEAVGAAEADLASACDSWRGETAWLSGRRPVSKELAAGRLSPAWRDAVSAAATRTRGLFAEGRPVCDLVRGRLRYELRVTWLGGMLILDRLEEAGYDVFTRRPTIGRADAPGLAWRAMRWSGRDRGHSGGPSSGPSSGQGRVEAQ